MDLLSKTRLNTLTRRTYGRNITVAFYKVTPTAGETEIATLTSGFFFVREQRAGQEIDGSGVKFWLSADAAPSQLSIGGVVAITVKNRTTRYKISDLLPMQQLGSGYVLRLSPQKGPTG